MGALVAQFAWAGDGIMERERLLLEELAYLARDYPELAGKVAAYPWMNAPDAVSYRALRGVAEIRRAAAVDAELAQLLVSYRWLQDGFNSIEARALANIVDLAEEDVETAVRLASHEEFIEGKSIEQVGEAANMLSDILQADPEAGRIVAAYPLINDSITDAGTRAIASVYALTKASGPANAGIAGRIAQYPWVADGVTRDEYAAIWAQSALKGVCKAF